MAYPLSCLCGMRKTGIQPAPLLSCPRRRESICLREDEFKNNDRQMAAIAGYPKYPPSRILIDARLRATTG
ncbi:hypothetical protein [Legionella erythra]|uniref:hypothetical protein n=1 Tax=Legionella erythra TaxID=448 RepID=UPI000AC14A4F|nr:hypothetical protein [Legionella erythra]